jgi:hypothetical protein
MAPVKEEEGDSSEATSFLNPDILAVCPELDSEVEEVWGKVWSQKHLRDLEEEEDDNGLADQNVESSPEPDSGVSHASI